MAAPSTAQICVYIGTQNKEVWVNPPNFMSLEMTRLAGDASNEFTLNVLDTDAFDLEYELLNNTGGSISFTYNDYDHNVFKKFQGYVTSLSHTFIENGNRNLLKIGGFVGISMQDRFGRYSFAWNKVPSFAWGEIFTDFTGGLTWGETSGYWAKAQAKQWEFWDDVYQMSMEDLAEFAGILGNTYRVLTNWNEAEYGKLYDDPDAALNKVFATLKVDTAGNFYLPKLYKTGFDKRDTKDLSLNSVQRGEITIPMKPSNIVKFIGRGGKYSELLESDFENYKGTKFYNGSDSNGRNGVITRFDWKFIQKWYQVLGEFRGCGWKVINSNIEDTDFTEADLTQTKQSFVEYIRKILMPNSTKTESGDPMKNATNWLSGKTKNVSVRKANFLLTFGDDGTVYYKRVNITNNPTITARYYLYGDDGKNPQNSEHGRLTSFSATTDVLTSMITSGLESGGDISTVDLVTGEVRTEVAESSSGGPAGNNISLFSDWENLRISLVTGSTSKRGKYSLGTIQSEAERLCYQASATIEGPCRLSPQDYIEILVLPRDSKDGGVTRHHTSGKYYVQKIVEHIDGGKQYATLTLYKNVGSQGLTADGYTGSGGNTGGAGASGSF